jgi:hypothetical protein
VKTSCKTDIAITNDPMIGIPVLKQIWICYAQDHEKYQRSFPTDIGSFSYSHLQFECLWLFWARLGRRIQGFRVYGHCMGHSDQIMTLSLEFRSLVVEIGLFKILNIYNRITTDSVIGSKNLAFRVIVGVIENKYWLWFFSSGHWFRRYR